MATSASPVGSYASSCSGADDPNYTFTYVAGTVDVTPTAAVITASDATMTEGDDAPAITPSYSGLVNGDTAAATPPTCSTTADSSSAVGTYPSTCSGAADPNYTFSYVDGTVTVDADRPVPLTITAASADGELGGTVPTITPSYSGLINGDTAPVTPPTCTTTATVGRHRSVRVVVLGCVDPNYTITYVDGTVEITRPTATASTTRRRSPRRSPRRPTVRRSAAATINVANGGLGGRLHSPTRTSPSRPRPTAPRRSSARRPRRRLLAPAPPNGATGTMATGGWVGSAPMNRFDVYTVSGGKANVSPTSLTILSDVPAAGRGMPSRVTADANNGVITYVQSATPTGTLDLTYGICRTGTATYSAADPTCATGVIHYSPGVTSNIGGDVTVIGRDQPHVPADRHLGDRAQHGQPRRDLQGAGGPVAGCDPEAPAVLGRRRDGQQLVEVHQRLPDPGRLHRRRASD